MVALQDRTIGLVTEILQAARTRGELVREVDPLVAARAITHITSGARVAWANGLLSADACRAAIDSGVDLLFRGLERRE